MSIASQASAPIRHADRFFIGGQWVAPSSDATIKVIDPGTEELYFSVAEAQAADIARAVGAAREAFDSGPWPRLTHEQRADYLRALAAEVRKTGDDVAQVWPREAGVIFPMAKFAAFGAAASFDYYADLAATFAWEEPSQPARGGFGLLVREPVGVVGSIIPWNAPMPQIGMKLAPALIAGCTVILKTSPEAPGEGYLFAAAAEAAGLPPGVINVVTADREVSELLVRDPRVDKISFTGSTAAGKKIASICGERIARCTLELGGKSAAVILDDYDLGVAAKTITGRTTYLTGQVCAALTRIVVDRRRHDDMVEALSAHFKQVKVGNPFDSACQMGPLAMRRQRDRVEGYISKGKAEGAQLAAGGGRPPHLNRGFFIEPTVFGNVDNQSTIAREEIFGPVLSVIPAENEENALEIANETNYGLNAAVFTNDIERYYAAARRLRAGSVGHNGTRTDFSIAFGGFKQSVIGREGGVEGLFPFLESKTMVMDSMPPSQEDHVQT